MECPPTDRESPRADEQGARFLVQPHISGRLVYVDAPDFIICDGSTVVGGWEVTRAMDEGFMRLGGQLESAGGALRSDLLDSTWDARLSWNDANLRRWDPQRLLALAKVLEQHGLSSDRQADPGLRDELRRMGVTSLSQLNRDHGPHKIYLHSDGYASWVDPTEVDRLVVERGRAKRAVLEKIAGERHLLSGCTSR